MCRKRELLPVIVEPHVGEGHVANDRVEFRQLGVGEVLDPYVLLGGGGARAMLRDRILLDPGYAAGLRGGSCPSHSLVRALASRPERQSRARATCIAAMTVGSAV